MAHGAGLDSKTQKLCRQIALDANSRRLATSPFVRMGVRACPRTPLGLAVALANLVHQREHAIFVASGHDGLVVAELVLQLD